MIYTVTLNPAVDYVLYPGAPSGDGIRRTASETMRVGGKGINVSRVLSRLGMPTVAWGFAAGFTGEWIVRQLQEEGLRVEFDRLRAGNSRINVKLAGEPDINAQGPAVDNVAAEMLLRRVDALTADDTLVLSGALAKQLTPTFYAAAAARAAQRGATLVADTTGQSLLEILPYRPLLVKPNVHELAETLGRPLQSEREIAAAAAELQRQGAQYVLVSLGENGALLREPSGHTLAVAAPRGIARCTVGTGDTMVAGFLMAHADGYSAAEALCFAVAAGSATAFAGDLASSAEILTLLPDVPLPHEVTE